MRRRRRVSVSAMLKMAQRRAAAIIEKTLRKRTPKNPSEEDDVVTNPLDNVPVPDYSLKKKMLPLSDEVKITKPYRYQRIGIKKISYFGGRALLADEMGLGKTIQSIMWWYRHRDIATPVVIVCPANLKENWVRELWMHVKERPLVLNGRTAKKQELWKKPPIIILNYEIVDGWKEALKAIKPKLIIIDEVHRIKNMEAKSRKAVADLSTNIEFMIAISGTPVINRPSEIYSCLNLLRPNIWNSESAFMWKYTKPRKIRGRWQFTRANIEALPHLNQMLNDHVMIRRLMSDVFEDLPQRHRIPVLMSLTKEGKEEYQFAEREFGKWLAQHSTRKARRAVRAEQMVKMGYLKRLAAKLKVRSVKAWIDGFLEEQDEKLVVFGIHKKMIATLKKRYEDQCVVIVGDTPKKDRMKHVDAFQGSDRIRLMLGNLTSAGVGLNLSAARTTAFAELGWTPGEHTQGEARVRRVNKLQVTNHFYLIAPGTIEEDLCRVIQEKQKINDAILDGGTIDEDINIFDILVDSFQERTKK